jgi:hypothetical protein
VRKLGFKNGLFGTIMAVRIGAMGCAWPSSFYRWLGFPGGAINMAALAAAAKQITAPIAAATPKAESKAGPDDAITGPIRAVAINPPVRATALFSPDAAPVCLLSTDINTAVVSGATAQAIPKAITTIAGNTPSQ